MEFDRIREIHQSRRPLYLLMFLGIIRVGTSLYLIPVNEYQVVVII